MARRKKIHAGYWERGHLSHHYWSARGVKLGSVVLDSLDVPLPHGDLSQATIYKWNCGNLAGEADGLNKARTAVEQAHFTGCMQLSFFDLGGTVVEATSSEKPFEQAPVAAPSFGRARRRGAASSLLPSSQQTEHETASLFQS